MTVADDLLKNDGKKFIEMMEQLAERRMQREEESRMVASGMGHPAVRQPQEEEEEEDEGFDDDEDDEDYNSEDEDEFEDEEMVKHIHGQCHSLTNIFRRPCQRNSVWRKDAGCSKFLPPGCSSNAFSMPTVKKWPRSDKES